MELQEIIKKLKFICNQEGLTVKPDTILEQSVDIMLSEKISESQKSIQEMKNKSKEVNLATEKQKSLMTKFHIPFTDKTTSKEASKLIDNKFKELKINTQNI